MTTTSHKSASTDDSLEEVKKTKGKLKTKPHSQSHDTTEPTDPNDSVVTEGQDTVPSRQNVIQDKASSLTGYEKYVPLNLIIQSDNPRQEPRNLATFGYKLVDRDNQDQSLLHMALSEDIEVVKRVVDLFEEHENYLIGYVDNDDMSIGEAAAKSIVGLAQQFVRLGQLQPVVFRSTEDNENVSLIFGQRRVAASIYLTAKSKIDLANKVEGAIRWEPAIRGLIKQATEDEAYDMAVSENFHREDFTPLQEGAVYARYLDMTDERGKKLYTLKEIAERLGVNQGRVRSYAALVKPRDEETHKGLTDQDREDIEKGKKTVTWGVRRALNEKHYSETGERQTNRARAIPLKEMHRLFDNTAESKIERRQAIAECMGIDYEEAIKESEIRILESDHKDVKKSRKRHSHKEQDESRVEEENSDTVE